VIVLYQAEWCPYSSKVRERLTELGVDFVARQVEPYPEERMDVQQIPTLELENGVRLVGTDDIFSYLAGVQPWEYEEEHKQRCVEHRGE
jgi:glutathione S-transferase